MANRERKVGASPWHTLLGVGSFAGWTDGELLERFTRGGDEVGERAFAVLVERHGAAILRICRGVLGDVHDADDAFQATFLVLARRARSIRDPEAVGPWLLGVAYRVAGCARAAIRRRRTHERRAAKEPAPVVVQSEPGDCVPLLREEIGRLPEKFRSPLVLCYLEGLTQEEVARRLGWPIGTVRSRLARGRDRLRRRLVLRGVSPAAAAIVVESWREAGASVLPRALVARTAATVAEVSRGSVGTVATPVATLGREVLGTMNGSTLRMHAAAWLTAGLLVAGAVRAGVLAGQERGEGESPRATAPRDGRASGQPEQLPVYVVRIDRPKAADLGLTIEDVRRAIATAFDPSGPMSHRIAWIDPASKDRCVVRITTPDAGKVLVDRLLDVMLVGRQPIVRLCPLRNVCTLTRENRRRLEAEVQSCEAGYRAAKAEAEQAQARLSKAGAALEEAEARLKAEHRRPKRPAEKP